MKPQSERLATRLAPEVSAMNSVIGPYVHEVRAICSGGYSLSGKVRRIEAAATRHLAKPLPLSERARFMPEQGYGRNLMYRDDDHGFVVIAFSWPPNTVGKAHDHQTWGVVAVSEGSLRICNFDRDDNGRDPERAELVEIGRIDGTSGAVGHVLPPHEDIHSISNLSDAPALSIHTYGRDIKRCRIFDEASGKIDWVDLAYHHEFVT
jgi:predicted metal-dependent enzyme (double-stranded beta helix superfamily)